MQPISSGVRSKPPQWSGSRTAASLRDADRFVNREPVDFQLADAHATQACFTDCKPSNRHGSHGQSADSKRTNRQRPKRRRTKGY